VQAGQIISYLSSESPKNQAICKWLSDAKLDEDASSHAIYYKSEALSLFKCTSGKFFDKVQSQVKSLIATPDKYLTSVDDFYHAYLIDLNAKQYGFSDSTKLKDAVDLKITKEYVKEFDEDTFSLKG